jgi:hypothetical protein
MAAQAAEEEGRDGLTKFDVVEPVAEQVIDRSNYMERYEAPS